MGEPAATSAHPIRVLWTTPRSRSTAFERMMVERGDHEVFNEPFSVRYYYSEEGGSGRYSEVLPDSDGASIVGAIREAARHGPVFAKAMAYQAADLLTDELLGSFTNSFLIRDPAAAIGSFAEKWPDLTEDEAGYGRLAEAYDIACRVGDRPPAVIESDELASDPPRVIARWCEAVGIEFMADALSWEPGMLEQWELWEEWYQGVAQSTGFRPPSGRVHPLPDDPHLRGIVERARPVYERLRSST